MTCRNGSHYECEKCNAHCAEHEAELVAIDAIRLDPSFAESVGIFDDYDEWVGDPDFLG